MINHRDLSPAAIKKAVISDSSQKPLSLLSAMGVALGGAFALLIEPTVTALVVTGASGLIGITSFSWDVFLRGDQQASRIVESYRQQLEQERLAAIKTLSNEFFELDNSTGTKQLELFEGKFQTFVKVLERKFNREEFTFNRYRTIAEQVYLGGIDELNRAVVALRSIESIDTEYLRDKLASYEDITIGTEAKARAAVEERLALHKNQLQRVENIFHENEVAMTSLDKVSAKISSIDTQPGQSSIDYDQAMDELHRLIKRADIYSIN